MKRKIGGFLLFATVMVLFCVAMTGCCLKHEFAEATCTEPKTCVKCGKTEGEALGHEWSEATCTKPKTCSACGATEGAALGHKIEVEAGKEATCTEDGLTEGSYCTVCGEVLTAQTTIPAIGHDWEEATVYKPKTCKVCGATEGEKKQAKTLGAFSEYVSNFNAKNAPTWELKPQEAVRAGDSSYYRLYFQGGDLGVSVLGSDEVYLISEGEMLFADDSNNFSINVDKIDCSYTMAGSSFNENILAVFLALSEPIVQTENPLYSADAFMSKCESNISDGSYIFYWDDGNYYYNLSAKKKGGIYTYCFAFTVDQ